MGGPYQVRIECLRHGVEPVTAARMNALGIYTGLDLRLQSLVFLTVSFGKAGAYYYGVARGQDERPVEVDRARKSAGAEETFACDLTDRDDLATALAPIVAKVWSAYQSGLHAGRTVTLKIKFADFQQITRSRSGPGSIIVRTDLERGSLDLLRSCFPLQQPVRLLGITISNLAIEDHHPLQLALPLGQAMPMSGAHPVMAVQP